MSNYCTAQVAIDYLKTKIAQVNARDVIVANFDELGGIGTWLIIVDLVDDHNWETCVRRSRCAHMQAEVDVILIGIRAIRTAGDASTGESRIVHQA